MKIMTVMNLSDGLASRSSYCRHKETKRTNIVLVL